MVPRQTSALHIQVGRLQKVKQRSSGVNRSVGGLQSLSPVHVEFIFQAKLLRLTETAVQIMFLPALPLQLRLGYDSSLLDF